MFGKLFGKKKDDKSASPQAPKTTKPAFAGKQRSGNSEYEVYRANDAQSARTFLLTQKVDKPQYYIVVETPEGNWGTDVMGLYLEHLLPWQTNLSLAQASGVAYVPQNMKNGEMAARGLNDNYVTKVACGNCKFEWFDGVRYQNTTIVRCPQCKQYSSVNTSNFNVIFVGGTTSNKKYASIVILPFEDSTRAQNGFVAISQTCHKVAGLSPELKGTAFELHTTQTSMKVIVIRAQNDDKRNQGLIFAAALGVFGDVAPIGSQQGDPNANQYSDLDDRLRNGKLEMRVDYDELPTAPPCPCPICNGKGHLNYKNPHSGFALSHQCYICGGKGQLP